MKKINLQFGDAQRLSKDQMKMITGGGEKVCLIDVPCTMWHSGPYGEPLAHPGWCNYRPIGHCACYFERYADGGDWQYTEQCFTTGGIE